jgi:hypothetical protein
LRREKKILYSDTKLTREVPSNYLPADRPLFEIGFSYTMPAAYYYELSDIVISDYFIFSKNGFVLRETFSNYKRKISFIKLLAKNLVYLVSGKTGSKNGKHFWAIDEWGLNYFHWFADVLPKYYYLKNKEGAISLLLPDSYRDHSFITASLSMLDIPHDWLSRKSTKIESLYYPDISAVSGNNLPGILKQIGIGIVKNCDPGIVSNQRIYISRKFARFRKVINEDELLPILEKFGFKVYYFESMNFQEQVKLVSGAEIILGMHGAGMMNMIFMPGGRKVVEFIIGGKGHNNCYYSMANSMGLKYYYLVTSSENPDQPDTNVKVDPIQLTNLLEKL